MPRVSVVIPTFNCEPYVAECVRSVTGQTERDLEILVVDDRSTDGTPEIVRELAHSDRRISLLSSAGKGCPGATRNRGLERAQGTYICFLDGDDFYHPEKVSLSVSLLESLPQTDLVFHDCMRFSGNTRTGKGILAENYFVSRAARHLEKIGDSAYTTRDFYAFMSVVVIPFFTCSVMIRRALLDSGDLWFREDLRTGEDIELWLRLAQRYRVAYLDHVLSYYRRHPGSLTSDPVRQILDSIQVHSENLWRGSGIFSRREIGICHSKLAGKFFDLGYQYFLRSNRREARVAYWNSMKIGFRTRTLAAYLKTFAPTAVVGMRRRTSA